jgi:hypothetical protein
MYFSKFIFYSYGLAAIGPCFAGNLTGRFFLTVLRGKYLSIIIQDKQRNIKHVSQNIHQW